MPGRRRHARLPAALLLQLHAHPHLQQVLDADWITTAPLISEAELVSFAWFAERLVVGTRTVGEAAVLAYADVHRAVAVVDDGAGRKAANDRSVTLRPTLSLLCEAIRNGLLTVDDVGELADELLETKYRFPFARGGFEQWAGMVGLI